MATFSDPCTEPVEGVEITLVAGTPHWHLVHVDDHNGNNFYEVHTHENGEAVERALLLTTDDALARRWFAIASTLAALPELA